MGGIHVSGLIVALVVALAIVGPKTQQAVSRHVGKRVGQARVMREKVMAELPLEEIAGLSQSISKLPLSPQQALQRMLTMEPGMQRAEINEGRLPFPVERSPLIGEKGEKEWYGDMPSKNSASPLRE